MNRKREIVSSSGKRSVYDSQQVQSLLESLLFDLDSLLSVAEVVNKMEP